MDLKLQKKLFRKYPEIFQDRRKPGSETRMCDGICCGDGWFELIDDISRQLSFLTKYFKCRITLFQVKEKFAGLRYYINRPEGKWPRSIKDRNTLEKIIYTIKSDGERKSWYICEECGKSKNPPPKRLGNWLYAMCDDCWKKFLKNRGIKIKKKVKKE